MPLSSNIFPLCDEALRPGRNDSKPPVCANYTLPKKKTVGQLLSYPLCQTAAKNVNNYGLSLRSKSDTNNLDSEDWGQSGELLRAHFR